jgi:hypothetical protein
MENIFENRTGLIITLLESPSIYAGDGRNRKPELLSEGGVKAPSFLTGFTPLESPAIYGEDDIDVNFILYRKVRLKTPSFLTGFTKGLLWLKKPFIGWP